MEVPKLKINYFNKYCCISLPFINKEYDHLSYEIYGDKGYSALSNFKNYKNSDDNLHITFTYNKTECYFLKITLNKKVITTFIKPKIISNDTGISSFTTGGSPARPINMNINRDRYFNRNLTSNEFIKTIDTSCYADEDPDEDSDDVKNEMELLFKNGITGEISSQIEQLKRLEKLYQGHSDIDTEEDSDDDDDDDESDGDESDEDSIENLDEKNLLKRILKDSGIELTDSMICSDKEDGDDVDDIDEEEEDDEEDEEED